MKTKSWENKTSILSSVLQLEKQQYWMSILYASIAVGFPSEREENTEQIT